MSFLPRRGVAVTTDPDGVAQVVLDRPSAGNALDLTAATALADAIEWLGASADVRAVVLGGSGRSFCVGGDVEAMAHSEDRGAFLHELALEAHRAVLALATLRQPLVVAVNGAAAGAGLALTLQGDTVIAGESSQFVPAYIGVGLTPDCGLSLLLPEVVGLRSALDLLLNNRGIDAAEALRLGLVGEVVPDDQVLSRAVAVARDWALAPHPAVGETRWLVRLDVAERLRVRLELEADTISAAGQTPASIDRIDAFMKGRTRPARN